MRRNLVILLILSTQIACGQKMNERYITWDDFVNGFGKEMLSAENVYNQMLKSGLIKNSLAKFDFQFISDTREKLDSLSHFILEHYPYETKEIEKIENGLWELHGITNEIPVTEDNLLYWALDMYNRGYENDAKLDGYGALFDHKNPKLPNLEESKEDFYFDKGVDCYNSGDLRELSLIGLWF